MLEKDLSTHVMDILEDLGVSCMYNSAECQIWQLEHGGMYKEGVCKGCPYELGCAKLSMIMKEFNDATRNTEPLTDIGDVIIVSLYHTFRIQKIINANTINQVVEISRSM